MLSQGTKYLLTYSVISVALLAYAIEDSRGRANSFFAFMFELTDGTNLGIVLNFITFCFIAFGKLSQLIMFGELREIEREHIIERLPFYIINSLVMFSSSTTDGSLLLNVLLLGISTFSKVFHWILVDRTDHMNLTVANTLSTGGPYGGLTVLKFYLTNFHFWWNLVFLACDVIISKYLVYDIFQGINSVTCLLFGFQFAMQALDVVSHFLKTCLTMYELAFYPNYTEDEFDADHVVSETGETDEEEDDEELEKVWESKGIYVKSVEIFISSCKLVSYLSFIYLLTFHTSLFIPVFMLQGGYFTCKDVYKQFKQLRDFLESSKRLDSQLPNATMEQLASGDNSCIVCLDNMRSAEEARSLNKKLSSRKRPKVLPCGHILHMGCLKDWLERSDNCPLCRRKVFDDHTPTPSDSTPANTPNEAPAEPIAPDVHANVPAFHHPPQELYRRFEEFENLLRQQREQAEDVDVPPPAENGTQSPGNTYHQIYLPNNAVLPPNWTILPVDRSSTEGVDYSVGLSSFIRADLRIRPRARGASINIIDPNFNAQSGDTSNFND